MSAITNHLSNARPKGNKAKGKWDPLPAVSAAFLPGRIFAQVSAIKYKDNFILKGGLFIYTLINFENRAAINVEFLICGISNDMKRMDEKSKDRKDRAVRSFCMIRIYSFL